MPSPLKVVLTLEQDRQLLEITQSAASSKRTKQRAEALRLSSRGWTVYQIAEYFDCNPQTIRQTIHKWRKEGISGLDDRPKTGRPRQWQEEDMSYLEKCLREDAQVYNSKQLSRKLEEDRKVTLSSDRIRKVLKQKGWVWKRARIGCDLNIIHLSLSCNRKAILIKLVPELLPTS